MATATQALLIQPPFAAQLSASRDQAMGITPNLQKGYMIWDNAGGGPGGVLGYKGGHYNNRAVFNFMYNPTTVQASFATESTGTQANMLYSTPGSSNILAVPLSQSAQWTLYFDRTYEVNYGIANNTTNDPSVIGVQADVVSLMQFTGMLSNKEAGVSTLKYPSVNKGGVMMNIEAWCYFGQNVNHNLQSGKHYSRTIAENRLGYYGFVQAWDVNYTAFTQDMVPYRATVDITFQMLPSTTASQASWSSGAMAQGVLDPFGNLKNYSTKAVVTGPA